MTDTDVSGDFVRYLQSKRTVDDRALDRRVWERLRSEVGSRAPEIRVVDVGAGIGTGLARMIEWGLFEGFTRVSYLAVEANPELASSLCPAVNPVDVEVEVEVEVDVRVLPTSLEALEGHGSAFDLVVAHAVLDILELESSLDRLVALGAPGGLLYFPITFDGETIWEPALEEDEAVMEAYHATMTRRGRTGRRLLHALERRNVEVLEAASSDWIVRPRGAAYPHDEAFFLEFLLETVRGALEGRLSGSLLETWMRKRRRHLADGELVLIAHQLDVLAERR